MKTKQYSPLYHILFGYAVAYIYALQVAVYIGKEEHRDQYKSLNKLHEGCMIGCGSQDRTCQDKYKTSWWTPFTQYRGKNYYIGVDQTPNTTCFATFWSLSHFALYAYFGYKAPQYFWTTFFIGALFEWFEKEYYDCHDALDIAFNTAGFLAGTMLLHHQQRPR